MVQGALKMGGLVQITTGSDNAITKYDVIQTSVLGNFLVAQNPISFSITINILYAP